MAQAPEYAGPLEGGRLGSPPEPQFNQPRVSTQTRVTADAYIAGSATQARHGGVVLVECSEGTGATLVLKDGGSGGTVIFTSGSVNAGAIFDFSASPLKFTADLYADITVGTGGVFTVLWF